MPTICSGLYKDEYKDVWIYKDHKDHSINSCRCNECA